MRRRASTEIPRWPLRNSACPDPRLPGLEPADASAGSEGVVRKRREGGWVGGRRRAADAVEGLTPDVFVLGTGREAAERPPVEVIPEADCAIDETPVVRDALRRRAGRERSGGCDITFAVVEGRIPVAEWRRYRHCADAIEKLRIGLLEAAIGVDVQALPRMSHESHHGLKHGDGGKRAVRRDGHVG